VSFTDSELAGLISRARRGGNGARGQLLELYRNYLGILARLQINRRLQGKVAPSDLVQETFLEADRNFAGFRGRSEGELIVWLRRVLSTQVARLYRHNSAQKRDFRLEQHLEAELDQSSQALGQAIDSAQTSPSRAVARREEAVLLSDAMERLPADYREVILLRNLEGLPFDAAASRIGTATGTFSGTTTRADAARNAQRQLTRHRPNESRGN